MTNRKSLIDTSESLEETTKFCNQKGTCPSLLGKIRGKKPVSDAHVDKYCNGGKRSLECIHHPKTKLRLYKKPLTPNVDYDGSGLNHCPYK